MTLEELTNVLVDKLRTGDNIEKEDVSGWLEENYKGDAYTDDVFDKLDEINSILSFTENASNKMKELSDSDGSATEFDIVTKDLVHGLIYAVGLIEARKLKLNILKLQEDLKIEELYKQYSA